MRWHLPRAKLDWKKHVSFDERYLRPAEVDLLIGDATKAKKAAGVGAEGEVQGVDGDYGGCGYFAVGGGAGGEADSGLAMKVFVAGHRGMVGSAVVRALEKKGGYQILTRTRTELDLTDPKAVSNWFSKEKPDQVIDAAARVGGILGEFERRPVEFLLENLRMQNNLMESAFGNECRKFLIFGEFLYLSEACGAADSGGFVVEWTAGADERCVCIGEDCGGEVGPSVPG